MATLITLSSQSNIGPFHIDKIAVVLTILGKRIGMFALVQLNKNILSVAVDAATLKGAGLLLLTWVSER